MQKFAGKYRKTTLRWAAAGVLAGSALFVGAGATSAAAAAVPNQAPGAVSSIVEGHWKFCEASVTRHGREYAHLIVRKHGHGWSHFKRLHGFIHYSKRTKPAVYRLHGHCAKSLGGLFHHKRCHHHMHHVMMPMHHVVMPTHRQVTVVPRGPAKTGAGGSMHVNSALLAGGAALGLSGLGFMVIPGRRRTTDLG